MEATFAGIIAEETAATYARQLASADMEHARTTNAHDALPSALNEERTIASRKTKGGIDPTRRTDNAT